MTTGRWVAWVGAAALAVALFFVAIRTDGDTPSVPAAERDLFPFLKYGGAAAAESTVREEVTPASATSSVPDTPMKFLAVEQTVKRMRTEGASDDEIYRMRAAALTPENAARMAHREGQERMWNARVDGYLAERERLRNSGGNTSAAAFQQLRDARFTAEEQDRLAAYESSDVPQLIQPGQ